MYNALTLQYAFIYDLNGFYTKSLNMELKTIKHAHGIASENENMCETFLEKILTEGRNCLLLSLEGDKEMMTVTQSEYRCWHL